MRASDVDRALVNEAANHLRKIHWDGMGCGTHGVMACSNCHGPSPMDAHEVALEVLLTVLPTYRDTILDAARKEIATAYKRGPGWNLQESSPSGWRKGMSKAHRIVRDFQRLLRAAETERTS